MKELLRKSENANPNYLATICKIKEVFPLENSDFLVRTVINGYDMIISKDTKPGTIVVYFPCESVICEKYLSTNNLYEASEYKRNFNAEYVDELISNLDNHKIDVIREHSGFFNKHGRVRMIKLRGHYSQGFVASVKSLTNAWCELPGDEASWEELVGTQFNMVGDEELCHKYIPYIKESQMSQRGYNQRMKKLKKFDKIIPGEFEFHYDTTHLAEHIRNINPSDIITATLQVHGTSCIISNVLCNKKLNIWQKIGKALGFPVKETEYSNIYSSRSVIKNRYMIEPGKDFYDVDIWGCVNREISEFVKPGMTVYGEIVGYLEGQLTYVQKGYDYYCPPRTWKFMPYRITTDENGDKREWNVDEVWRWTVNLMSQYPDKAKYLMPIQILYNGRFDGLYPELSELPQDDWYDAVLVEMKCDDRFGMEQLEPLCYNEVPREGIVIRIENDKFKRAWKLKCKAFQERETKAHDKNEFDIEENA